MACNCLTTSKVHTHHFQNLKVTEHSVVVFDILEPQGTGQIYSNPLMNCTSMGESHDRWKDGRRLKMLQHMECVRSGDIGFAQMSGQPETDRLDMGFPLRSQINRLSTPPSILALDMGFQPAGQLDPRHACDTMNSSSNTAVVCPASTSGSDMSIENDPLDMGFSSLLEEDEHVVQRPLDMGFCRDPVHDVAARSLDMQLDQLPLNMGFQTDPASCHSLDIEPDDRSLDMGFDTLQPERHPLDMGFNTLQPDACPLDPVFNELQPDGHPLDMGFNTLQLDVGSLDPAFNAIQLDEHPLDMGFGALHPVHPDQSMDIQLDQKPLDMGFGTATPDPLPMVNQNPLDL
ncbi:uncharacterized protein F5891DRAFT_986996 [Suillus fuscotomentosus]|uniref:Uncharacterized protein n=1 Tax=Suillus fuscotomentosus TaxID=1912939 RepID=A0AAD4HDK4_9AGAM|nr:uncharacterized protein F5891DRAFT_986996 [Suillus fuscotomentosus]KAG1890551.1 hypothetical protein F5891DRAFT_986996 [Suillus fuscotomentosus]